MAVWGSGGMKRRVQLELNAPRVNWPILQSQPLECVLSDGTYPLSLSQSFSLSVSLSCCTCSPTHPLAHTLSLDAHTHTHTPLQTHSLTQSVSLTQSLDLVTCSFILSFAVASLCSAPSHFHQLLTLSPSPPTTPCLFFFFPPPCPSFSLYFLPSLISSLSLSLSFSVFDPCRAEEPPGRRTALVPIVHSVQSDRRVAQRAAAGRTVLCVFYCMTVNSTGKACCCCRCLPET